MTIKRPHSTPDRQDATKLRLGLVEVCEEAAPARVEPLIWRLLTTLPVATRAHALEVVRLYCLRWRIEEVFRILKSNGLKLEDSQLETADRLLNLAAFGLVAAARIIQLVDARDGSTRPATDVIEADNIKAAAAISTTLGNVRIHVEADQVRPITFGKPNSWLKQSLNIMLRSNRRP